MKYLSAVAAAVLLLSPLSALAHEHRTFTIGDRDYSFVIGSMNEPVRVDDKSGVEIMVEDLSIAPFPVMQLPGEDGQEDEPQGSPAGGLESTLKVEVSAGDKKKTFDLRAAYGEPGSYNAVFYPTVQTTYTYRLFGTVNNVPFDVSFPCNPAGHPATPEDTTPLKISDQVTQKSKSGAFGCPQAKSDVQFPEQAGSLLELTAKADGGNDQMGTVGLVFGILGFVFGLAALGKVRKSDAL